MPLAAGIVAIMLALIPSPPAAARQEATSRIRARAMGVAPGTLEPGANNAITDVAGVAVGHTTIYEGNRFRTGVTAILPHQDNVFERKVTGFTTMCVLSSRKASSTSHRVW